MPPIRPVFPRRRVVLGGLLALPGLGALAAEAPRGVLAADAPHGATLVMLERHDCPWCRRWLREVGETAWNLSDLGQRAPLRRVDVARGLPEDLRFLRAWRFTPTFVLVADGGERGRIIGYHADLFFWQQAEALIALLSHEESPE